MNSYELSRRFFNWSFENPEIVNTNHVAIYFFAIEHCNRLGWRDKFGFPTQMVMDAVGIKKHQTYIKYFNDLVEYKFFKLIQKSQNQYSSNIISLQSAMPKNGKALDKAIINHGAKQTGIIGQSNSPIDKPYNQITNNQITNTHVTDESVTKEYLDLVKNKENIFTYIKTHNPKFPEPYIDYWNIFAVEYDKPQIRVLNKQRTSKLRLRLKDENFSFTAIIKKLTKGSDFALNGKWLNFDWIIANDTHFVKIMEGNYDKSKSEINESREKELKNTTPHYKTLI